MRAHAPEDEPTAVYPVVPVAGAVAEPAGETRPSGLARRRRRRQIQALIAAAALGVSVAAAAVAALGFGGPSTQRPPGTGLPPATATVTRMTLTQTERLPGTLGFGPVSLLIARPSAMPPAAAGPAAPAEPLTYGLAEPSPSPTPSPTVTEEPTQPPPTTAGATTSPSPTATSTPVTTNTITWLPPIGAVIDRGQPVYKVDNQSVVLLIGSTPLFRVLTDGLVGPDVRMLEENLAALGYTGLTVDATYTSATATAVKRWQRDLGLPQTGTVDVNRVAVAPAALRVAEHRTTIGQDAAGEVLAYTGTAPLVSIDVPVNRRHLLQVGQSVTLTLPDGRTVTGSLASIGTVATVPDAGGAAAVQAEVTISPGADLGGFDAAPVGLEIVVAEHPDVLTVPVGALVALAEGGYGVQVIEGSRSRYVAVETGMFAMGRVEVTGVEEGMVVGVPA